jgi:hypothetical protein
MVKTFLWLVLSIDEFWEINFLLKCHAKHVLNRVLSWGDKTSHVWHTRMGLIMQRIRFWMAVRAGAVLANSSHSIYNKWYDLGIKPTSCIIMPRKGTHVQMPHLRSKR